MELTENEWLSVWCSLSFLIDKHETGKKYWDEGTKIYINEMKELANKIHRAAFPVMYKYGDDKKILLFELDK